MSDQLVYTRLRSFISKRWPRAVGDDESLIECGALDSLGILELVAFVEEEFHIQLSDEEVSPQNFRSISSVAGFLIGKMRS